MKTRKNDEGFSTSMQKKILALLRDTSSPFISRQISSSLIHPRAWIPAPCLTSPPLKPQRRLCQRALLQSHPKSTNFKNLRSFQMDSEVTSSSSSKQYKKKPCYSDCCEQKPSKELERLKKEKEQLKKALVIIDLGEDVPPELKALILKWRNHVVEDINSDSLFTSPSSPPNSNHGLPSTSHLPELKSRSESLRKLGKMYNDLKKSYEQVKVEEKHFLGQLKPMGSERRKLVNKENKPVVKIKKGSNPKEFKYIALKRKYKDLLQYLKQVERSNAALKKENNVLHSALKKQSKIGLQEKLDILDQEISTRNAYIKELEDQLKNFHLHEGENARLKNIILKIVDDKKKDERKAQCNCKTYEDLENQWTLKLKSTKRIFEKAIQGYKEELASEQKKTHDLEKQLHSTFLQQEQEAKKIIKEYETQISCLKEEMADLKERHQREREEISLLKLETVIHEKEAEIELLKNELKKEREQDIQSPLPNKLQEQILSKLEEILNPCGKEQALQETTIQCLKDTIQSCFDNAKTQEKEFRDLIESSHLKEIKILQEASKAKDLELSNITKEFEEAKHKVQMLTTKCEVLESKVQHVNSDSSLDVLKDFPQILKENEAKLAESQSATQNCLMEKALLMERLRIKEEEVEVCRDRAAKLESQIRELETLNHEAESKERKLESKIEVLEMQIERKDHILDRNSAQLEDRIRDYASMASQVERLKEELKEKSDVNSTKQFSQLQSKLQELQSHNSQLESRINIQKMEKFHTEKSLRKEIRSLEDELIKFKGKNAALVKRLESIKSTYKSLFAGDGPMGHNNPAITLPFPPDLDFMFDFNDPVD